MPDPSEPLAATPAEQPPTWVRWRIVAILMAYSFMTWFNRVSMSVAGDERIMPEYGISPTLMGWVYSGFIFSYALLMTPGGWFCDRFGGWRGLAIMGFGSALFGALTGMVGLALTTAGLVWLALLVSRILMGAFTAPVYPASARIIAHWLPFQQRAWANGLVIGFAPVGIASTFFGFGTLLDWFDWPVAFLLTGVATALLALLWTLYGRDEPRQHRSVNAAELLYIGTTRETDDAIQSAEQRLTSTPLPQPSAGWLSLLANRSILNLTFSYAALNYLQYLFFFWMRFYLENELKLATDVSRLCSTILFLSMAVGMWGGGWVSDWLLGQFGRRRGRAVVPLIGMTVSALMLALGLVMPNLPATVACFSLALAANGASEGPFWATAIDVGGRHGATAGGIVNTGGNAGGLIAPIITPWVGELFGWGWAIALGSVVCLSGACLWLWIDPDSPPSK